jgi:hypothetical protein
MTGHHLYQADGHSGAVALADHSLTDTGLETRGTSDPIGTWKYSLVVMAVVMAAAMIRDRGKDALRKETKREIS